MNIPVQNVEASSAAPPDYSEALQWSWADGRYPKTFDKNVDFRARILLKSVNNPKVMAHLKACCADDILFWLNVFCQTYNPRLISQGKSANTPFITYKYEDDLILQLVEHITSAKDILIDKSRDMGVTWCVLAVYTWLWQFHGEGNDFLVGSRKEQYIDVVGNMDTLIEKVRFLIRTQPRFLLPPKFDWKRDSNYMKIINPATKSTITGEATNENFSRGGRRRSIFFDEFAFWEVDQAAWRASADSTNCRIVVSTPCGYNNHFAKLRFSNSITVKSLHWTLHPDKDQKWYEAECIRRNNDPVEIAQELDINYEGSEEGILFNFNEMKEAVKNEPVMSTERIVVSLDPASEGDDEAVFYVCNNGNIVARKFIRKCKAEELAAEAVSFINKYKAQVFICDAIGNDVISLVTLLLDKNPNRVKLIAFKSSEKAKNPLKYKNRRAEIYHEASTLMKSGNIQVDDDYTLMKQLNATKYLKKNEQIELISKDEIKEQVGSSPDRADSWVLAIEGLKYTHSLREVVQANNYRKVVMPYEEILPGNEYGDWGDTLQ